MIDPVQTIKDLVRAPSVSTDPKFLDGLSQARDVLLRTFREMGLETELLDTPKHPVVLAHRNGPGSWPHVLIYGHYDVQPPDPLDLWASDPFDPVEKDGVLYGRGVADNKGPMMVHIAAVARLLEKDPDLPLRLTFLIEGEEEIGSPSFPKILEQERERLRGDFVLLSDTVSPSTQQIAITTGLRGVVALEFEVSGPKGDLHSGLHGGAVYNPIRAAAKICAALHDETGRVTVPGFYQDVVEARDWEKAEIDRLVQTDESYARTIGVPRTTSLDGLSAAQMVRLLPTLEFNGIGGGYQGEGEKTIIPSKAFVKITCRLVALQDPGDILGKVETAIREHCPPEVELTIRPGHSGPPYQVVPAGRPGCPEDLNPHLARAFEAIEAAVAEEFGEAPLFLPEGGSIPIIGTIRTVLGMDSLMLGMFTPENNLHAPNENFDLASLEKGTAVSEKVLQRIARG